MPENLQNQQTVIPLQCMSDTGLTTEISAGIKGLHTQNILFHGFIYRFQSSQ